MANQVVVNSFFVVVAVAVAVAVAKDISGRRSGEQQQRTTLSSSLGELVSLSEQVFVCANRCRETVVEAVVLAAGKLLHQRNTTIAKEIRWAKLGIQQFCVIFFLFFSFPFLRATPLSSFNLLKQFELFARASLILRLRLRLLLHHRSDLENCKFMQQTSWRDIARTGRRI